MKKIIILVVLSLNVMICFGQKKTSNNPTSSSKCKYPKDEMKGKTQKEQLKIMRAYLDCKKLETENSKRDKNSDMNSQQAKRERIRKEREQNNNTGRTPK